MGLSSPKQISTIKHCVEILTQRYAKNSLNKIVLTTLQTTRQIYSTRDRKDGQAVGQYVLRRKGSPDFSVAGTSISLVGKFEHQLHSMLGLIHLAKLNSVPARWPEPNAGVARNVGGSIFGS